MSLLEENSKRSSSSSSSIRTSKTDSSMDSNSSNNSKNLTSTMEGLLGTYECVQYNGTPGERNPWHHVTITTTKRCGPDDGKQQVFQWKNRAGVAWNLMTLADEETEANATLLEVESACPYHTDGHTHCQVERDEQGRIVALLGPWGERYVKNASVPALPSSIKTKTGLTNEGKAATAAKKADLNSPDASCTSKEGRLRLQMKGALYREKAEQLRLENEETRRKQAALGDYVEDSKKLKAFTDNLAAVAQNIQAISTLKDTLPNNKGKDDLDRMIDLLVGRMLELTEDSVGNNSEPLPLEHVQVPPVGQADPQPVLVQKDAESDDGLYEFVEIK